MKTNVKKLISQMTLEEKAGLLSGSDFWHTKAVERLGIPAVMLSDGPHGLRKQEGDSDHLGLYESIPATCFPSACATASSFDTALLERIGDTLGNQCQAEDVSVLLGPGVNIKRSPLCGRNFEYFSEDPYLAGKLAAAYIKGVQKHHVGTSIKHFAGNNQEYKRMSCSSEIDERTLREVYLTAFEIAVKESQPKTVMASYNRLNGTFASENEWLISKVLRDEWGFEGYVVTDWGAVGDRVKGLKAGNDLEMPGSDGENDKRVIQAVREGCLDENVVDQAVERILSVMYDYLDNREPDAVFDRAAGHREAVEAAKECAVLLENNGVLPLKPGTKAAYIGAYAAAPRFQGGGSSHINASQVSSALARAEEKGRDVIYVEGFPGDKDELTDATLQAAVEAAKKADVAVIFAGLPDSFESEGYDRTHMRLPECQDKLIFAVSEVQPNTVVVLHNGSSVECPWAGDVAAVLEMYLGGQGVGEAADSVLWGDVNPSGRLAETFPIRLEDNPSFLNYPGNGSKVEYREGVYVGYRYYDKKRMPVRWAFGHGLSYTEFLYSDLRLSAENFADGEEITVQLNVRNTGHMTGKEVVQLYVADRNDTAGKPVKELRGFEKIELRPGETKTVHFTLNARDLSYYNVDIHDWFAPSGKYGILIGHASDDIRLTAEVGFTTQKLLPFTVTTATTVGELMEDIRTRPVITELLANIHRRRSEHQDSGAPGEGDGSAVTSPAGIPLKSLVSFRVMTNEKMYAFMDQLNEAVASYNRTH